MPFTIRFWIFLHIILFSKLSSAQQYTKGIFVNSPLCKKAGVQCADDCLTLLVCGAVDPAPIQSVLCAATSSKTPYCTKNACSATIGACPTTTAIFQCTDIGIYPDPNDCTRYRNCNEVGILASYWQCPSGFNFNSKNGLCDNTAACDTINCSNYLNQIVAFKSNPRFYAVCYRGLSGQVESAIYKCNENLIFSSKTQTCDYECVSSGYFEDITDCHNYFVCSGTVGNFKWTRIECPQNYFFNGTMCVTELSTCSSLLNPPVVTDPDGGTTTKTTVVQPPIITDPNTTTTATTINQPPTGSNPDSTTTTVSPSPIDTDPDTTTTTTTVSPSPTYTDPDTTTTTTTAGPSPTNTDPDTTTTTTAENPPLEPDDSTSTTVKPTQKYPITSIPYR